MDIIIAHGIGVIIGSIITNIIYLRRRTTGTLKIDQSNPDKDVYRIELDYIDELPKKKEIVLKVDNTARFSQD